MPRAAQQPQSFRTPRAQNVNQAGMLAEPENFGFVASAPVLEGEAAPPARPAAANAIPLTAAWARRTIAVTDSQVIGAHSRRFAGREVGCPS